MSNPKKRTSTKAKAPVVAEATTRHINTVEEFLAVVMDRETYPDRASAAKALNMTEDSFKQRFAREAKDDPDTFRLIPSYKRPTKKTTPNERLAALAKIKGVTVEELQKEIQAQKDAEAKETTQNES